MSEDRYFIQDQSHGPWEEVTRHAYVVAERTAGFQNTMNRQDDPATTAFSGRGIAGRLCYGGKGLPEDFIPLKEEEDE